MIKCKGCSADFTAKHELHIHIGSGDNYQCREKYTSIERYMLLKAHIEFRKKKKSEGKEEDKNGQSKTQRYMIFMYYLHQTFFKMTFQKKLYMLKILFLELTKMSVNHQTQLLIHFHKQETIQQEHHFNHSKKIYQRLQMAKNYPGRQCVNLKVTKG